MELQQHQERQQHNMPNMMNLLLASNQNWLLRIGEGMVGLKLRKQASRLRLTLAILRCTEAWEIRRIAQVIMSAR